MAKVITFSRTFPVYHPKAGKPTFFVEKFLKSIDEAHQLNVWDRSDLSFINQWTLTECEPKHHTIRVGNRWKLGDKFSPRIWSDKPYKSKQIQFAPDTEIKKIYDIEMDAEGVFYINGKYVDVTSSICDGRTVADNDGLSSDDLLDWFPVGKPFKGQIICWNENINY